MSSPPIMIIQLLTRGRHVSRCVERVACLATMFTERGSNIFYDNLFIYCPQHLGGY